jgi:hypothetical protein
MIPTFKMKPNNPYFALGYLLTIIGFCVFLLLGNSTQKEEFRPLAVFFIAFAGLAFILTERCYLSITYEENLLLLRSPLRLKTYRLNKEEILGFEDTASPFFPRGSIPYTLDIRMMKVLVTREGKRIPFYLTVYDNYKDLGAFFEANFSLLATRPFRKLRYYLLILLTLFLLVLMTYLVIIAIPKWLSHERLVIL